MFDIKKEATDLVLKYCGSQASGLYGLYFKDKTDEAVIASLEKLLKNFVGDEKTAIEMRKFKDNNIKI